MFCSKESGHQKKNEPHFGVAFLRSLATDDFIMAAETRTKLLSKLGILMKRVVFILSHFFALKIAVAGGNVIPDVLAKKIALKKTDFNQAMKKSMKKT